MGRVGRALLMIVVLMLTTLATNASAQDNEQRARELFHAGVNAYKTGKFLAAAQAFIEARKLLKKPQLLFSTAQAFRRQFDADGKEKHLRMAVKYYEQYLAEVPEGGRRLDAARALSEIKPYLRQFGGGGSTDTMTFPTRLSVTSPVADAVVSIDGGPLQIVPYNGEIKPGPHKVVVRASGYFPGEREFVAKDGDLVPIDVPLRGVPPTLDIKDADGAELTVDGKIVGTMPLARPVDVTVGSHFVAVTERGHKAYAAELSFEQGASTTVTLDLPATNQRRWAYGVLTVGGASLAAGAVLGGLALAKESDAKDIEDIQAAGNITEQQRIDHNDALDARDRLRLAGGIAAGAGVVVGATGLFLYLFDEPEATPPPATTSKPTDAPSDRPPEQPSDVEIMGTPAIGPGLLGLQLTGRF